MSEETVEETAAEAAQRPPETARVDGRAATQFKPGNTGPRHSRKGQGRGLRKPPKLLADMRRVYAQDESQDRTPGQKRCRSWLNQDPAGFLSRMADLEKAHAPVALKAENAAAKAKPPAEPEEDLKEEEVLKLIGKLIDDFHRTGEGGR